ncbi:hypothetical protein FSP39_016655 [Pinctada imbricata]|uniref:Integrase catalytic domain-containing protein n=1 Tax=Pinctada imbricata TaxID=66713 RepID=A0AA89BRD5_PINIB|nr:hypothetical protein FSP39_016655 [Pinctada imbricata]
MNNLPDFPTFDFESDKSNAGPKWDRWIGRLENLFVAIKINNEEGDDARKRALLLHYCGERVYDIYMAEKGESDETYPASKKVLEDYFKPRKNTQMEIYQFRLCKQKQGQTLDEYVTELRRLSKDCEFQDVNNEILSQLIQNCRSNQLRRRALREPEKGLDDIIKLGRAMELSDSQAQAMERSENVTPVNAISRNRGRGRTANRGTPGRSRGAAARRYTPRGRGSAPRGRGYTKSCFNCGGRYPHNGPCPAKGQQCHKCHQMDHFKKVCKGRGSGHVRSVEEDPDLEADSDDSYCYVVRLSETEDVCAVKGPYTKVKVNGVELTLLADSDSSVNILDESSYCKVGKPKLAKMRKGKLVPYGGGNSLKVLGICTVQIETKDRIDARLTEHGMTLNGEKCEFRQESVTFFGVVFSGNGISPDPKKVKAVNDFEKPQNVKELKSFLGMTNYCSRFIADYTKICDPLRKLTRKDVDWSWNENCEKAFMELKQSLSSKNVMSYYDPEKPVEVRVDASPIGFGAILAQDKIVAYASRSLTPVESRYSQVEREALAVVWACEHFDVYLRGLVHFKVITDHKPLEKIWKKPQPPLRIERWGLRLQPYKFDIEYSPGEDNAADYMSRHPVRISNSKEEKIAEEYINVIASESLLKAITLDEVKAATMNSPTLQTAISYVRNGRWFEIRDISDSNVDIEELTALRSIRDELTVFADNVLLRGHRIVLPQSLRDAAISIAHEGHQGVGKTKAFLRSKVWFPGLDSRVDRKLKDCVACQVLTPERTTVEPLKMSELPSGPWENLSMDFCGPLPSSEYLLVVVDEYTRYPVVEIVKSVSSNTTIPIIDKVFSQFGIPKIVKTDNGSPFQSERFKLFMEDMGIMHRRITPRWPRANAQAESFNRPLMKAVKSAHIHKVSWKQEMNRFLRQYRFTPHTSTGYSPYKLLFARDPKTKLPQVASDRRGNLYFDENVRTNDSESKRKMKENTDRQNSAHHRDINIGDSIIVKYDQRKNKLQPVYKPEMKTVLAKKGSMVTISGDITRNMSQVKKVKPTLGFAPLEDTNEIEIAWPQNNTSVALPEEVPKDRFVTNTKPPDKPQIRQSDRKVKIPSKFKDFVLS